jgi:hypothetical protein
MKYQVFECDKPADCKHHDVDESWDNSAFDTLQEALEYARNWLGAIHAPKPEWGGERFYYHGKYYVEVREVE